MFNLWRRDIKKLDELKATRILIAGSYLKELTAEAIKCVLSEKLSASVITINKPAKSQVPMLLKSINKNDDVAIVVCDYIDDDNILNLSGIIKPTIGVITGISRSHIKKHQNTRQVTDSYFELNHYMAGKPVYKNRGSGLVAASSSSVDPFAYDNNGIGDNKVENIRMSPEKGTFFELSINGKRLNIQTRIIGEDAIGVCLVAAAIGVDYGLSEEEIESGLKKLVPFDSCMEPKKVNGGWLIDDTSNSHPEGAAVGLRFLKDCKASRKIYATSGLDDETHNVKSTHNLLGHLISASADVVYLVKNNVSDYILEGLTEARFEGDLLYINNPKEFYANPEKYMSEGDVMLIQNPWPTN